MSKLVWCVLNQTQSALRKTYRLICLSCVQGSSEVLSATPITLNTSIVPSVAPVNTYIYIDTCSENIFTSHIVYKHTYCVQTHILCTNTHIVYKHTCCVQTHANTPDTAHTDTLTTGAFSAKSTHDSSLLVRYWIMGSRGEVSKSHSSKRESRFTLANMQELEGDLGERHAKWKLYLRCLF
jgi:hypothetical protein